MSESPNIERPTTKDMLDKGQNYAVIGVFISLFAFALAVTTPWIYDNFAPPPPTIEDVAVEKALDIREKVVNALVSGEVPEEEIVVEEPSQHWTDSWPLIVMSIALGGIICGTLGFLRKDHRPVAVLAIFFGISSIVAVYMWIALAVFVCVILVAAILSAMGVSI